MSLINRIKRSFNESVYDNLNKLSARERRYFNIMRSQSGVLYVAGKPGIAKSAIMKSISDKLGFVYKDVRLSMVDETDVGLYPDLGEHTLTGGDIIKVLDHVVPKWAVESNSKPTIINFEELNRAPLAVRNAALQLLLEREIGTEFKFNDNVLMVACGNLGDEDGTDVDEFDTALKNRLIHVHHEMPAEEWITEFANDNVHPDIVKYIKEKPHLLYPDSKGNDSSDIKAFATHRSWTFLSDYILNNFGEVEVNEDGDEFLKVPTSMEYKQGIVQEGSSFIGKEHVGFLRWLEEMEQVNIDSIIEDWDSVKEIVEGYRKGGRRDKYSEFLIDLFNKDWNSFNKKNMESIVSFLKVCSPEERTKFILEVTDSEEFDETMPNFIYVITSFKDEIIESIDMNNKKG